MKKAFLEKILAMGMVIAVFMTGNMYAYAVIMKQQVIIHMQGIQDSCIC